MRCYILAHSTLLFHPVRAVLDQNWPGGGAQKRAGEVILSQVCGPFWRSKRVSLCSLVEVTAVRVKRKDPGAHFSYISTISAFACVDLPS